MNRRQGLLGKVSGRYKFTSTHAVRSLIRTEILLRSWPNVVMADWSMSMSSSPHLLEFKEGLNWRPGNICKQMYSRAVFTLVMQLHRHLSQPIERLAGCLEDLTNLETYRISQWGRIHGMGYKPWDSSRFVYNLIRVNVCVCEITEIFIRTICLQG